MATWDEVRRVAVGPPGVVEESRTDATVCWQVSGRTFAWERPLRGSDLKALGESAPTGPVLAVRVTDIEERAALIADDPDAFFTTPHFADYPAVLVQLDHLDGDPLRELITDAWLLRASGKLAEEFWRTQPGEHERIDRHASGSVKARGTMRDGVLHGAWQWFRVDGSRLRSGSFDHGREVGTWTTYDRAGRPHTVTTKG